MYSSQTKDQRMGNDKILLEGLAFYGYHGLNQEEKILGQRFIVDVSMELDLQQAGKSDDLNDTVSYSAVYDDIREIIQGPSVNLLEALAEKITQAILRYEGVQAVTVRVKKPEVPLKGSILEYTGVQIRRTS